MENVLADGGVLQDSPAVDSRLKPGSVLIIVQDIDPDLHVGGQQRTAVVGVIPSSRSTVQPVGLPRLPVHGVEERDVARHLVHGKGFL